MSSFLVDSNIFIYATDENIPQYKIAKKILENSAKSQDEWCISWQNIYEFISVATNRKAFHGRPLSLTEAIENVEAVLSLPNIRIISETERHWEIFLEIIKLIRGVEGVFVYDCKLAAILKENEVKHIITADEGFKRFHFLKVQNPFSK